MVRKNRVGSWLVEPDEIAGMTPAQIKEYLALPTEPVFVSEVQVPAGTSLRRGTVGTQEGWGVGGATQYELLEQIPRTLFKNQRKIGQ